jgi:Zn finger protein HypA/HybF involved in hydrogenase expression
MVTGETKPCLTCESCGAKLSWPIVRGLTSKRDGYAEDLYCPACRSPMEQVNVQALQP